METDGRTSSEQTPLTACVRAAFGGGIVAMSERERERAHQMRRIEDGQVSQVEAAALLKMSGRNLRRLLRRWREQGDAGLVNCNRSRPGNRQRDEVRDAFIGWYAGLREEGRCNPTHPRIHDGKNVRCQNHHQEISSLS